MPNAWVHATYYGAKYNAKHFGGSKVNVASIGVDPSKLDILWQALAVAVLPSTTCDLFMLRFWNINRFRFFFTAGTILVCALYDTHLDAIGSSNPRLIDDTATELINFKIST